MSHTPISTGAGWACLKCKRAWDQGDKEPEDCTPDAYPFNGTDPEPPVFDASTIQWPDTPEVRQYVARIAEHVKGAGDGIADKINDLFKPDVLRSQVFPKPDWLKDSSYVTSESFDRAFPKADPMSVQVAGTHYAKLAIQPTEFCMRNGLDFCIGSILKYVTRHRSKNGLEDLKKARHFVEIRESFPWHIRPHGKIEITMLEYVTRNSIRPDDAEALYRLEAYYRAIEPRRVGQFDTGHAIGARRLIDEIDTLITTTY